MAKNTNEITDEQYNSAVFEDGGSLIVDLSSIQEMSYEAVPKGIYNAEIETCEYQLSKSSGAPMFSFMLSITDGDYTGRKLFFYASFSPKALAGTKTSLLRIDPTIFNGPFRPEQIAEQGTLIGKPIRIKVSHEEYNGEARARVQSILPPGDAAASNAGGKGAFFG